MTGGQEEDEHEVDDNPEDEPGHELKFVVLIHKNKDSWK